MSTLNTSLSIATNALLAQEAALAVTNNNIANVNTPGYSRQAVVLQEASPTDDGPISLGGGVDLVGTQSIRDELLNLRIQQQTSQQSSADAQVSTLMQVQALFPTSGASIATDLSAFSASLSALSTDPTSAADRQAVLSSGRTLATQFNSTAAGLSSEQSSLNTKVSTDVDQINQLSSQAAALNQQIAQQTAQGQDSGVLGDQLNQVELQLSTLTSISVTHSTEGDTISTGNGSPLVLGSTAYGLTTGLTPQTGSSLQIFESGEIQPGATAPPLAGANSPNITNLITGGDLHGTIQERDVDIPGLLNKVDTIANQFAASFNTAQAQGSDQNGIQGAALFTVPATVAGSAAAIEVSTTDPTAIAAASHGSASGSNGNIANLIAVQTMIPAMPPAAAGSQSIDSLSSGLVYQVGELTSSASAQSSALALSLSQLTSQQGSVSGVSIDEESANLIRYQQAYEAAAKVISTISELFTVTINMVNEG